MFYNENTFNLQNFHPNKILYLIFRDYSAYKVLCRETYITLDVLFKLQIFNKN